MNKATLEYVRLHADEDVRQLALRGTANPDIDLNMALQQIQGRQQARRKLPTWAHIDDIVYPPHLNMEQCSSELTALYKADICRRMDNRRNMLDLTGGLGVDFAFMQQAFSEATYVERNAQLHDIAKQNFHTLGLHVNTVCADACDFLQQKELMPDDYSLIFLDPARRDTHGARTYGIADCTPDVLQMLPTLLRLSDRVLLKLSPMLDWRKAVADLGASHVAEVHIVAVQNECKELLILLQQQADRTMLHAVNDHQTFTIDLSDTQASSPATVVPDGNMFLYEPNASLMKAGCFNAIAQCYGIAPLARDSHLFASPEAIGDFPGRQFAIQAVTTMNKRDLRRALQDITQANITTRNFPLSVAELRRRLKLADGGDTYIFATTLADDTHVLIICKKQPPCL